MMRKLAKRFFPAWTTTIRACQILASETGLYRSCREGQCVDGQGEITPWYTFPALEMLKQWDFRDCVVFEYGSGNSTIFWSRIAKQVFSVEENSDWYERLKSRMPANAHCQLARKRSDYINAPRAMNIRPDVIIVDGRLREACSRVSLEILKPGGLIILDNSDWYHSAAAALRDAGLIEIDFTGFGPLNSICWTTSFFLHRDFRIPSCSSRQPTPGVGASPISRTDESEFHCFEPEA
jgi:hypothetical protein